MIWCCQNAVLSGVELILHVIAPIYWISCSRLNCHKRGEKYPKRNWSGIPMKWHIIYQGFFLLTAGTSTQVFFSLDNIEPTYNSNIKPTITKKEEISQCFWSYCLQVCTETFRLQEGFRPKMLFFRGRRLIKT